METVLNISTQINTTSQIIGLLIISIVIIWLAILTYKAIRFIGICILNFRKVDVGIDKGDISTNIHLRQ